MSRSHPSENEYLAGMNEGQRLAAGIDNKNLLVSAAAGSGKTMTLTKRCVRRMLDPDNPVDADRLLIVTFTRDAAAQMKLRITDALQKANTPAAARQLRLLAGAQIGTIDSFWLKLVKTYADELGLPVNLTLARTEQLTRLENSAAAETVSSLFTDLTQKKLSLIERFDSRNKGDLANIITEISDFLNTLPDPKHWVKTVQSRARDPQWWRDRFCDRAAQQLHNAILQYESLLNSKPPLPDNTTTQLTEWMKYAKERLDIAVTKNYDALQAAYLAPPKRAKSGWANGSERLQNIGEDLRTTIYTNIKKMLPDGSEGDRLQSEFADLLETLLTTIEEYRARADAEKRSRGLFGFADITRFAADLLICHDENGKIVPTGLAKKISQDYDEILLDEVQDVNQLQFALFTAISKTSNRFMVGDVKQSIYRFRHAAPEVFLSLSQSYRPLEEDFVNTAITLDRNYRSDPSIVDAVNHTFGLLMHKENGGIEYSEGHALVCGSPESFELPGEVCVCLYDKTDIPPLQTEAALITAKIKEMVGTPISTAKGVKTAEYSDFCIMTPTNEAAGGIAAHLTAHSIPAAAIEGGGGLGDIPEISGVAAALTAIDNPINDINLLSAMMSPVWDFTPDDMARIFRKSGREPQEPAYNRLKAAAKNGDALGERCRALLHQLEKLKMMSLYLPMGELINALLDMTGFENAVMASPRAAAGRESLAALISFANSYYNDGCSISEFISHLTILTETGKLSGISRASVVDCVTVCTIHKSKGLEYPVCFLAGTGRSFASVGNSDAVKRTPGDGITFPIDCGDGKKTDPPAHVINKAAASKQNRAENLRLLYVAMTRAQHKLFLPLCCDPNSKLAEAAVTSLDAVLTGSYTGGKSHAEWLNIAVLLHPDGAPLREKYDVEGVVRPLSSPGSLHIEFFKTAENADKPPENPPKNQALTEELTKELKTRFEWQYPYEILTKTAGKYTVTELAKKSGKPQLERPAFLFGESGSSYGNELHSFMQNCDFAQTEKNGAHAEALRLARTGSLNKNALETLDYKAIDTFFASKSYQYIKNSDQILREFDFMYDMPLGKILEQHSDSAFASEPVVVQGCADCIGVCADGLIIIDYKTDRLKAPADFIERYNKQLFLYSECLSKIFNKPIKKKIIYAFRLNAEIELE